MFQCSFHHILIPLFLDLLWHDVNHCLLRSLHFSLLWLKMSPTSAKFMHVSMKMVKILKNCISYIGWLYLIKHHSVYALSVKTNCMMHCTMLTVTFSLLSFHTVFNLQCNYNKVDVQKMKRKYLSSNQISIHSIN